VIVADIVVFQDAEDRLPDPTDDCLNLLALLRSEIILVLVERGRFINRGKNVFRLPQQIVHVPEGA
jgi:hypothetical protein